MSTLQSADLKRSLSLFLFLFPLFFFRCQRSVHFQQAFGQQHSNLLVPESQHLAGTPGRRELRILCLWLSLPAAALRRHRSVHLLPCRFRARRRTACSRSSRLRTSSPAPVALVVRREPATPRRLTFPLPRSNPRRRISKPEAGCEPRILRSSALGARRPCLAPTIACVRGIYLRRRCATRLRLRRGGLASLRPGPE